MPPWRIALLALAALLYCAIVVDYLFVKRLTTLGRAWIVLVAAACVLAGSFIR